MDEYLERIWSELLSREPGKIRLAYNTLDTDSQQEVLGHLNRMATEDGWHPEQVLSARIALETLEME